MKALYRRYRPIRLADVVGQPQVTTPLQTAIQNGKISHAYLFVGPRGTGKTSVARIFAHAVNHFDYELEDNYVDIIEIDGASNRGIDNIRDLKESAIVKPSTGKYKIYIIDEIHMLTKDAFNALLKTLEEPPAHVIFILATTDVDKVPITITSRSQTFTFELAKPEIMVPHLKTICEKEGIKITDEALGLVAERGGGSFRDTLSLLDQISTLSDSEITIELIEKVLGLPKEAKIQELIEASTISFDGANTTESVVKITTLMQELLATGIKADTLTEKIITEIMKNPKPEFLPLLAKLIEVKAPFAEAKLLVALTEKTINSPSRIEANRPATANRATTNHSEPATPTMTVTRPTAASSIMSSATATKPTTSTTAPGIAPSTTPDVASSVASSSNTPDETPLTAPTTPTMPNTAPSTISATPTLATTPAKTGSTFDWSEFLERTKNLNDSIYTQLTKCEFEIETDTLAIYPNKKIVYTILTRDNNKKVLMSALTEYRAMDPTSAVVKITVKEAGTTPVGAKKDPLLSKISDIMGGEVLNDAGGNPF